VTGSGTSPRAASRDRGKLAAIVLAAGYSSRMGRFKPLLPLYGSPVIVHGLAAFREAGVEPTVVLGHRGDEIRPLLASMGVRWVSNPEFDSGMYSSVVTGIRSLDRAVTACFVLPADMPAVRASTIARLGQAHRRTGASVLYPTFRGERGHPPLISSRLFPATTSGDGAGGLQRVLAAHEGQAREVAVRDEGVLLDLDTPEDYRRACEVCADRSVPTPAECDALLAERRVPDAIVRHGRAVAEVALRLAVELNGAGLHLDVGLVRAAGLLHDLAKGAPDHARAGARLLRRLGHFRVAAAVASHTDIERDGGLPLDEAALVYLADKLVSGDRIVPLQERFRMARGRFGDDAPASLALERRWRSALDIAGSVERFLGPGWYDLLTGEGQTWKQC
jgi:molybdenum cofactor cytidylyltransferase